MKIDTPRTVLKLGEEGDIPAILRYYTDNAAHFAATSPARALKFLTESYWKVELEAATCAFAEDRAVMLFVFLKSEPGRVIGAVNLTGIVRRVFQACYLGYG